MDVIRTEGDLRAFEAGKQATAERGADESAKDYGERVRGTPAYKDAMQSYGTGSELQRAAQAVTAALQGLAGGNLAGALAGASAPYLAQQIKQVAGDNETTRLMAHAVLGALVAQAQGNGAAAGAAGAVSGELIAKQMYPGKTVDELTEDEKQTVSALATLASGFAGAVVGGDASSAVAGAAAGKNAVENNHLTLNGRMYLKQKEREYASACGGAAAASDDCQERADEISKLRKLGDSVLETEYTVVGSEMGPDQFTDAKPGDIVACSNSANGFCQVTDEAIQTSAGKEWKLVAATDAAAAGQAQRNQMVVDRATIAAEKFGLDAYNSGCGSAGAIGVACQLYTSLGGVNPVSGYEPTTGERVLAGAEAILNSLGLVGAVRGGGVSGGTAQISESAAAEMTTIEFLPKATRNSAAQIEVDITQASAISTLEMSGYRKTLSKDGSVTVLVKGDKTYRFYPSSTSTGQPSASLTIEGIKKQIVKLRFAGESRWLCWN